MDSTSKRCVRKDQANAYLRTELEALAFDEIAIQTILHWPHSLMIRLQEWKALCDGQELPEEP